LFDVQAGMGLVAAAEPEVLSVEAAPSEPGPFSFRPVRARRSAAQCTVLVADPDTQQRHELKSAIEPMASILEAQGPGDCLARINREDPDLIVLAMEMPAISGLDITRRVRKSGIHAPIIVTGHQIRRLSDRVRLLGAGADLALPRPFDLRTFKLHVRNLLQRSGGPVERGQRLRPGFDTLAEPRRAGVLCTSNFEEFSASLESETRHCAANDLPFALVILSHAELSEETAGTCSFVGRRDDLTYIGARGAAILLTEAVSADPFLSRFHEKWSGMKLPGVKCVMFDSSADFAERAAADVFAALGTFEAEEPSPAWVLGLNDTDAAAAVNRS